MPTSLPLRGIPGYHPDMEQADTLHNLWLGPGKDTLGSLFMDVVQYHPGFRDDTWESGLQALCMRLHDWCAEDTLVDELKVPATCAWAVSQVGNTMDKAGHWFNESEAAQMVQCGLLYVQCHVWLAREALLAARPRYKAKVGRGCLGALMEKMTLGEFKARCGGYLQGPQAIQAPGCQIDEEETIDSQLVYVNKVGLPIT
eukprot:s7876_g3.t1